MSRRLPPALPVQQGNHLCPHCKVPPGVAHDLLCLEVTPQQFVAYVTWDPQARPSARRRLAVIAALAFLTSLPPLAVIGLILRSFL
ncbi:hypothetical protein [Micromonospora taraxaci]|uniref:hypothetical protein n=1 Tax=Micromonospora taraxaci TaxID=1316803 RepID=UPI0033AFB613